MVTLYKAKKDGGERIAMTAEAEQAEQRRSRKGSTWLIAEASI